MARSAAAAFCVTLIVLVLGAPPPGAAETKSPAQGPAERDTPAAAKTEVGVASQYGAKHAGKKTASGKPFNPHQLTAASRTLPLNSKADVTNLKTGKSVKVTITDRGPYVKDRVIDLSTAAAKQIGVTLKEGLAPVQVKPDPPPKEKLASETTR